MHTTLLKWLILPNVEKADRQREFGLVDYFDGCPVPARGLWRGIVSTMGVTMSAMPSSAQSEFYAGLLPVDRSDEPPPSVSPTTIENDQSKNNRQPSLRKRASRAFSRFLITFCIGGASTLAWQSYGDTARAMIANSYPHLGWLAPQAEPVAQNVPELVAPSFDPQQLNAMSVELDAVRQSIDRIATSMTAIQEQMSLSADGGATSQEQIARSIDQLTAGQEQMTREITKLQAVEQYVLYKNAEPPPRSAPAPARNQVLRSSQAR
jgi:hypothetical protein